MLRHFNTEFLFFQFFDNVIKLFCVNPLPYVYRIILSYSWSLDSDSLSVCFLKDTGEQPVVVPVWKINDFSWNCVFLITMSFFWVVKFVKLTSLFLNCLYFFKEKIWKTSMYITVLLWCGQSRGDQEHLSDELSFSLFFQEENGNTLVRVPNTNFKGREVQTTGPGKIKGGETRVGQVGQEWRRTPTDGTRMGKSTLQCETRMGKVSHESWMCFLTVHGQHVPPTNQIFIWCPSSTSKKKY